MNSNNACHRTKLTLHLRISDLNFWKEARNATKLQKAWIVTSAWNCFSAEFKRAVKICKVWRMKYCSQSKLQMETICSLMLPQKLPLQKRYHLFFCFGSPFESQFRLNESTYKILARLNFPFAFKILYCLKVRWPRNFT